MSNTKLGNNTMYQSSFYESDFLAWLTQQQSAFVDNCDRMSKKCRAAKHKNVAEIKIGISQL